MRAFILAGGLGTRLKTRFADLPKPLAPVGGRPFVARQLEWLAAHGIRDVVLCLGHGAEQVRAALGEGDGFGVRLRYSVEPEPLGTAGALRLALPLVDGPSLVLNGDTHAPCDPWALERARWEHGALGAVALFQVEDASARGRVEYQRQGPAGAGARIVRFVEKDAAHRGPAWVNGGLYAFDPRLWRWLAPGGEGSLEREVLPRAAAAGLLVGHRVHGAFYDIGTPEEWERAERHFATGAGP
jgi:NDP-sugar pyrophosphorylase family protein